ncbi:hypothetical protein GEMRC1_013297 [Eukaryota sp. GEM-RC1]
MGNHMKKKGTAGTAVSYITRTQAVRRLQVTLKDFRQLCILKGIFPRTPKRRVHGTNKTYYLSKDIKYLQYEPLLQKFRELKSFLKRHKKALRRREAGLAENLRLQKPLITLDHIIKERYPTFGQAVSELDDALSMIYLFASLPSENGIPTDRINRCQALVKDWESYISSHKALNAAFLSIKGVYLRAQVGGSQVLWLVPYPFPQQMPRDIDYKVMDTFVQFYEVLLTFVLYKLNHDSKIVEENEDEGDQNEFNLHKEEGFTLNEQTVLLGREVPRGIFSFLVKALGGVVAWDDVDSPIKNDDQSISIEICDRPKPLTQFAGREYVQPQWLVDCLNFSHGLDMSKYRPGMELPPHLSPFVDYDTEGYVPDRYRQINAEIKGEENVVMEAESEEVESEEEDSDAEVGVGVKRRVDDKEIARAKLMMPKKKKKLYDSLQKGVKEKEDEVKRLKERARVLRLKKRAGTK